MYCNKCGKELPDQTTFCTYCGARQNATQQPEKSRQTAPKKTGLGKIVLMIALVAVAILVVKGFLGGKTSDSTNSNGASNSDSSSIASNDTNSTVLDLTSSCAYGALYENDYLTYGAARLYLPYYDSLLSGEEEGEDYLVYYDQTRLFNVNRQSEIGGVSYDATTQEGILASAQSLFPNAAVVKFDKYRVNGYKVVHYILECTNADGVEQYLGEMIVFPSDPAYETIRFGMVVTRDEGYSCINQTFDTMEISSDFILRYEDTQTMGVGKITVK